LDPACGCLERYRASLRDVSYRGARAGPIPQDFRRRLHVDPETGCWLWTGRLRNKYGVTPTSLPVHRVVWEDLIGPIPPDYVLHHTCPNKHCANPAHLELMTASEHSQCHTDSEASSARQKARWAAMSLEKRQAALQGVRAAALVSWDLPPEEREAKIALLQANAAAWQAAQRPARLAREQRRRKAIEARRQVVQARKAEQERYKAWWQGLSQEERAQIRTEHMKEHHRGRALRRRVERRRRPSCAANDGSWTARAEQKNPAAVEAARKRSREWYWKNRERALRRRHDPSRPE
jgi:hypothetical protein